MAAVCLQIETADTQSGEVKRKGVQIDMKFGNGCWLQKEGIECFSPKEAYFVKTTEQDVTICAPTANINHRGDTLGGINLTVKISAPAPEVIRVQTAHHLGVQAKIPEFELTFAKDFKPEITDTEEEVVVKSGSLALRINKKTGACAMSVTESFSPQAQAGILDTCVLAGPDLPTTMIQTVKHTCASSLDLK